MNAIGNPHEQTTMSDCDLDMLTRRTPYRKYRRRDVVGHAGPALQPTIRSHEPRWFIASGT
jgi:hypothetical protein